MKALTFCLRIKSHDIFKWNNYMVRLHFRKIPVAIRFRMDWREQG